MTIALHATHSAVTCERDIAFESFLVIDLFAISPVDALFPSRVGGHLETNLRLRVRGKGFACLLHYLLFEDFECLVFLVGSLPINNRLQPGPPSYISQARQYIWRRMADGDT